VKLVTYAHGGSEQAGIVIDEQVYPLSGLGLPSSIVDLLALEDAGMEQLAEAAKSATASGGVAVSEVTLLPVIPRPPAIFLLAGNYQSHIVEGGGKAVNKAEITPRVFIKPVTSVIGPGDPILLPSVSDTVDYELEIAAVIGKRCKNVPVESAYDVVAGYVVFNDISARELTTVSHRKPRDGDAFFDWLIGKWCDSFAAIGPQLITRDEIPEPTDLEMSLTVNGELRQHSSAGEMIFTVPETIAYLSQFVTIEAGSLICMGTPGGVGHASNTFLKAGDVVVAEIEKLGRLENRVQ
jgi:2-keto-4-pentenoate hydratase/2-oxohepta-3-ene-1,7-dioic acid hydratase in catechol pathway